jgi:hypothetical protein
MKDNILSCREARQIDLVEYLAQLGYHPQKIHGVDHWYLSPFRQEKTPSFKVNKRLNIWYDHGEGRGGDLIDFGTQFHQCTIPELLNRLSQYRSGPTFLFQKAWPSGFLGAGEKEGFRGGKILILEARPLQSPSLIQYLLSRSIPPDIAARWCQEVDFALYGKQQTVIGFANRSGGYELRSEHFKGSSSPKDISFFDNRTSEIAVFEGFFNYLSFQTINRDIQAPLTNSLVLNSLAFLEKSRSLMEQYYRIHLLLDRDTAGSNATQKALEWNPDKYIDRSNFYQDHKDLNEWLIHERPRQLGLNQSKRKGRSI